LNTIVVLTEKKKEMCKGKISRSQEKILSQILDFKGRVQHPRWDIILMWSVPERSALQKHLSLYSCYNLLWLAPSVVQQISTN